MRGTENENDIFKRPRFIAYTVKGWPSVASVRAKRICANHLGKDTQIPKWAVEYEERVRLDALEALVKYKNAFGIDWPWLGHYCVSIRIFRPHKTSAEMSEIMECINRTNLDLFYSAKRNSREVSASIQFESHEPRVEVSIFRSIAPLEASRAA
jgi:hypothetical protein